MIYVAENYNTEITVGGEKHTLIGYVYELGIHLLIPNMYVNGKIGIGRRHKTITRLTANALYLNGFNLLDNIALVKNFFRRNIFPKLQQSEGNQYTLEEMNTNIDSTLKARLLPQIDSLRKQTIFVTDAEKKIRLSTGNLNSLVKCTR